MRSLNFNTGVKEFDINGDKSRILKVNTSDVQILKRAKEKEQEINRIVKECENVNDDISLDEEIELMDKLDKEVRPIIDYIFDTNASEIAFGNTGCVSIVENGFPLFWNFMQALLTEVEKDVEKNYKKATTNIEKYTSQVKK